MLNYRFLKVILLAAFVSQLFGCIPKIIEQVESLKGVNTEQLRDVLRHKIQNESLILFIHGFNSSKDTAWGNFPQLILSDPNFDVFNVERFGYPTNPCRQVSDIRRQGELLSSYLASLLREQRPTYRRVILIGHSMGGLVLLHSLLALQREQPDLIKGADFDILTFGTPFLGVQNTEALLSLCPNSQVRDMQALNDGLDNLSREWAQRFHSRREGASGVKLYTFRGTEDRFVAAMSACGYPQVPCETVDGDHFSLVKPHSRAHLSYRKLEEIALGKIVPPTAEKKIGIWVARLTGDDAANAAQRAIARTLEFYMTKMEPELQAMVEVREASAEVSGNTFEEKEAEAKRIGQIARASIIVWGDLTKLVGLEQFHPRITLVIPPEIPTRTSMMAPLSQMSQIQQLSNPPGTVETPPESVREPIRLARFLIGLALIRQHKWDASLRQFEKFVEVGSSNSIRLADAYAYAGFAAYKAFEYTGKLELLRKFVANYESAISGYDQSTDLLQLALSNNNLGLALQSLAARGISISENMKAAHDCLREASKIWKDLKRWDQYLVAQNNLAILYTATTLSETDWKPKLLDSRDMLLEADKLATEIGDDSSRSLVKNNLGLTYLLLAKRGVTSALNLQFSAKAFTDAGDISKEQGDWPTFGIVQNNAALLSLLSAERGVDPEGNLTIAVVRLKDASAIFEKDSNWPKYALVQNSLGMAYLGLAHNEFSPLANLDLSVKCLRKAAQLWKEQDDRASYALAQNNLGLALNRLAIEGINSAENWRLALEAISIGVVIFDEINNVANSALIQGNLSQVYDSIAKNGHDPAENFNKSLQAGQLSARLYKEVNDLPGYALAHNNLGLTYYDLSLSGINPLENLPLAVHSLKLARDNFEADEHWTGYATSQSNLGLVYRLLALKRVEPNGNFVECRNAFEVAVSLYKKLENMNQYALNSNMLGLCLQDLAIRWIDEKENLDKSKDGLLPVSKTPS